MRPLPKGTAMFKKHSFQVKMVKDNVDPDADLAYTPLKDPAHIAVLVSHTTRKVVAGIVIVMITNACCEALVKSTPSR